MAFREALITLVFPIKTFLAIAHCKLTNRDYTYSFDDLCDLVLFVTLSYWIYIYLNWANYPHNHNLYDLDWSSHRLRFSHTILGMSYNGDFDLFTFYAIMTVFIWGRLLVMLQLNRVFGPMLRLIFSMFGQVSKFLLIYIVTLICQTSVASLLFGEIEQY